MQGRPTAGSAGVRFAGRAVTTVSVITFAILALTPSILLFPQAATDDYRIALVALIVSALLYRCHSRRNEKRTIVIWLAAGAAITLATFLVLRIMPVEAKLAIPTPNIVPRLLGNDGELADDTFFYELSNEIWLCLAAFATAIRLGAAKLGSTGLSKPP